MTPWTTKEIDTLSGWISDGVSMVECARRLGRSYNAVRHFACRSDMRSRISNRSKNRVNSGKSRGNREVNRIASPLKWHGGKSYLASKLVAMMPAHTHYVEPFAGGLSVLLAKDPEGVSEVVNDLDSELTNLWDVLRDPGLYHPFRAMCHSTPFCESTWREAIEPRGPYPDASGRVRGAWAFFVRCRQSLAGRMKSFAPLSKNRTRRGMNEQASAWLTAIEGLPEVHSRLKRVVILNRDANHVLLSEDSKNTLFYCDPPYLAETRTAPTVYEHEMNEDEHKRFIDTAKRCTGHVMISGYPSELYDSLLRGWKRHSFDLPNNAAGGATKRVMAECVWSNF